MVQADAEYGVVQEAPFGAIVVTWDVPPAWRRQLAGDGTGRPAPNRSQIPPQVAVFEKTHGVVTVSWPTSE